MKESEQSKKGMSNGLKILLGCGGCITILVAGGIALSALGLFGAAKVAEEINDAIEEQELIAEEKLNNPFAIGEEVTVEGITWSVISAEDKGASLPSIYDFGEDCNSGSGRFIQVRVTVRNDTSDMKSTVGLDIVDSQGREFMSTAVSGCVDEELFILDNINPGITHEFVQTYEVPMDASGFKLKVTDLKLFEDNHEYIDLGL